MTQRKPPPLPPRHVFHGHLLRAGSRGSAALAVSLALGIAGYHFLEHVPWLDSLLAASMILTGMGPSPDANPVTVAGKLFASAYALFSGVVFLGVVAVLLQPVLHRFLHRFHLELDGE